MASNERVKIFMSSAVMKALDYKKANPRAEAEEIFQHIMREIPARGIEKAASIAAVDKAIRYKEFDKLSDRDALQKVMLEFDDILGIVD